MSESVQTPRNEKELLMAALELPSGERADFLAAACGDDQALKELVLELLKNADTDGSFMAQPAFDLGDTIAMSSAKVGGQVGRYRLMEQIGEGGMGVVFVAEQVDPVRRQVALKVIKPGMDSKQVIARFGAERQALAMMDHENIARVLDGGTTEQGLPYFVMELVRGLPITEYCDQAQASTRTRLELFMNVCSAVQHAHQKGIIHRDIKPSNVMVTLHDGQPVVKIIDFGVAKALHQHLSHQTVYTAINQVVGTPLYMSPEQMELSSLDIDTRTDVYSLGVLLYELLTGETPFSNERLLKSGLDEMRRIIREEEPQRPSYRITTLPKDKLSTVAHKRGLDDRSFSKSVQGELDWITLKALQKDRNRRYESASAFRADVQRYLDDESVLACPPSLAYRTKKLFRQHRVLITTASLVLIASLIGTVVSGWQMLSARQAKQQAIESNQVARQAVDDMYTQFAEKWLSEQGNASAMQREFLEKAMAYYEKASTQFANDASFDVERMKAKQRLSGIQSKLGQFDEAETALHELVKDCQQHLLSNPMDYEVELIQLNATKSLAAMLKDQGRADEEKVELDHATSLLNKLANTTNLNATQKFGLAEISGKLSTFLQIANRRDESEQAIKLSLSLWSQLFEGTPNSWEYRVGFAKSLGHQGLQRMWFGDRKEEAKASLLESMDRLQQLLKERPQDKGCRQSLSGVFTNLGVLASWRNQIAESIDYNQQDLVLARSLADDFPTEQATIHGLYIACGNLHVDLMKDGKVDEAAEVFREMIETSEKLVDLFPSVVEFSGCYFDVMKIQVNDLIEKDKLDSATQLAKQWREKLQSAKRQSGKIGIRDQEMFESAATLTYVDLLLEAGNFADAAHVLAQLNLAAFQFDLQGLDATTYENTEFNYLYNCTNQKWYLQRPISAIQECLELIEQNASPLTDELQESIKTLRKAKLTCQAAVDQLLVAWHARLETTNLSEEGINHLYWLIIKKERQKDNLAAQRRLFRESIEPMAMDLIRKMDGKGTNVDVELLSFFVGELTAGSESLREPQLALRMAQRAFAKAPDEPMSRQDLSWALFRNQRYQESLDLLDLTNEDPDDAMGAMILWHLGRKEEAAAVLNEKYETDLVEYVVNNKRSEHDEQTKIWPSWDNLLRLDREAKALIGIPVEKATSEAVSHSEEGVSQPKNLDSGGEDVQSDD